jgi:hypothetical protein
MPITNFDKVELLLPMTGANNGTVFTDYSLRQRVVTREGVVTSTAQSKFSAYGSSGFFNNQTTGAEVNCGSPLPFLGNDWCIGMWLYLTETISAGVYRCICSQRNISAADSNNTLSLWYDGDSGRRIALSYTNGSIATYETGFATGAPPVNTWFHLAVTRNGSNLDVWIDGVKQTTRTISATLPASTQPFRFGKDGGSTSDIRLRGHINDAIVVIGDPVYTANFTPPARMTQRELTRVNTGVDSHEYDRAVLFDWNAGGSSVSHAVTPDSSGDFEAEDLIDLEYGVAFIKDGCGPECRGPYEVDADT